MPPLIDKVALVTGGASGLGRAIAQRLGRDGAIVVVGDVQREAGISVAEEVGGTYIELDVTSEAAWPAAVAEIEARHGHLDILVNNAGILGDVDLTSPEETRFENWRRVFAVNVDGVFLGCRAALPAMRRAGGGSIVNISSVAGLLATPYNTAYGATKATVRQLTKSVAQHCAEKKLNIRCNSVHPGDVHTPLWDRAAAEQSEINGLPVEQILAGVADKAPLGGWTEAEDIAAGVAFLVSEDARRITGAQLIIDGGLINCDTYHLNVAETFGAARDA